MRDYGGVLFAQLRDWSGDVQLLLDNSIAQRAAATRPTFTAAIDLGDLVEVDRRDGRQQIGHPVGAGGAAGG